MTTDRVQALRAILQQNPADTLARYGLAMEHVRAAELEEAVAEFESLLAAVPDYLYAYYHAGQALEKLGRVDDAMRMYERGILAAQHKGDPHALAELERARGELGPPAEEASAD